MVTRAQALSLIARQDASEIWQAVPEVQRCPADVPHRNMGKKQVRYPVIAALPSAGFVTGEDPGDEDGTQARHRGRLGGSLPRGRGDRGHRGDPRKRDR